MPALGKLLRRWRLSRPFSGDEDFIFQCSAPRRLMNYKQLLEYFHDACEAANLNDVTFHALRHTFASILIAQDRDVQFVSRRYERASLIVTSNKPFSAWGEIFGDDATAAAMIDRLVHHAEILSLKGDSYRLKNHDLRPQPTDHTTN
jgi:IstB-like ATP binding protein/Phage integrase family